MPPRAVGGHHAVTPRLLLQPERTGSIWSECGRLGEGMAGRHEAHFFDAIEAAFDVGVGGGVGEDR